MTKTIPSLPPSPISRARLGDLRALEDYRRLVKTKIGWAKTYRAKAARARTAPDREYARDVAREELASALHYNGRVIEIRRMLGL